MNKQWPRRLFIYVSLNDKPERSQLHSIQRSLNNNLENEEPRFIFINLISQRTKLNKIYNQSDQVPSVDLYLVLLLLIRTVLLAIK